MSKSKTPLLLHHIAQIVYDKKGVNILALDVHNQSSLTDYLFIAEGKASKHTMSIAKAIIESLEKENIHPFRVEGMKEGDWIVLDYLDIMIHLFQPGLREKYSLEHLWPKSTLVALQFIKP